MLVSASPIRTRGFPRAELCFHHQTDGSLRARAESSAFEKVCLHDPLDLRSLAQSSLQKVLFASFGIFKKLLN